VVLVADFFQADLRICSQRKTVFLAAVAVLPAPPLATAGIDFEIKSTAIEKFECFFFGFGLPDKGISEGRPLGATPFQRS
jgi:hypothetical protein